MENRMTHVKNTLPGVTEYLNTMRGSSQEEVKSNEVFLSVGRVGKDPKLKKTKSSKMVCDFSIAVDTDEIEPRWINVNVWGKLGARLEKELKKGDSVFVSGSLRESIYTDRAGFRRTSEELTVKQIGKVLK